MSKWIAEFELEDGDSMPEHMDLEYMGTRIDFHCRPLQEPRTGQRINIKEFEEGVSRGCDYAGTQEVVHEAFLECIHDSGCEGDWDEMATIDLNDKEIVLQDLMERFYDKVARNIVNYAKTCEVEQ